MKQKIVFSLFLVLSFNFLISFNLSAQYSYSIINTDGEYYSTNILSSVSAGKGNTGAASLGDAASIYLNPAALNVSNGYQVSAGYNLKSETIKENYSQNIFSFSIAGAYRINKYLQTGFAYQNDYSYTYEINYYLYDSYNSNYSFDNHSFRVPVVYQNKWLRLGANINFSYYNISEPDYTANLWQIIPEFGTIITPLEQFSIGFCFTPGFKTKLNLKVNSNYNYYINNNYFADYPDRIKIGFEIRTNDNKSKFTFDYHYANISNFSYNHDLQNINLGFEYIIDKNWTIRSGFFSLQKYEHDNIYFLTLGTSFKLNNYSFNLAGLMNIDSRTGRGDYYVLNFGAGYDF